MIDRNLYRGYVDTEAIARHHLLIVNSDTLDEETWLQYLAEANVLDPQVIKLLIDISERDQYIAQLERKCTATHTTLTEVYSYGYCEIPTQQQIHNQNTISQPVDRGETNPDIQEQPVSKNQPIPTRVEPTPEQTTDVGGGTDLDEDTRALLETMLGSNNPESGSEGNSQPETGKPTTSQLLDQLEQSLGEIRQNNRELRECNQAVAESAIRISNIAIRAVGDGTEQDVIAPETIDVRSETVVDSPVLTGETVPVTNKSVDRKPNRPVLKNRKNKKRRKGFAKK